MMAIATIWTRVLRGTMEPPLVFVGSVIANGSVFRLGVPPAWATLFIATVVAIALSAPNLRFGARARVRLQWSNVLMRRTGRRAGYRELTASRMLNDIFRTAGRCSLARSPAKEA